MLLLQSAPSNPLNNATWLFPLLECWHILGFALSIGTIAIVDFRLLGIGMLRKSPQELAKDMYYLNHSFQVKMVCLLLAIVIHYTIRRKAISNGTAGKGLACVSLVL